MSMQSELFKYEHAEVPEDCTCLISPSQIYKFFDVPPVWYRENVLHEKPEFTGSTATVIGTICHYIYECVTLSKEVTREWINDQLVQHFRDNPNPDVDLAEVMKTYPLVSAAVVNQYVLPNNVCSPIQTETRIVEKISDGIYIAGTFDRLENSVLCDYKTVSSKPNETAIPFHYKIQLLAYAYALRKQGHYVDRIRIIYGVKPLKTTPARCFVVTEQIDDASEKLIEDTLNLMSDSIKYVQDNPDKAYLIFKSMDLKND